MASGRTIRLDHGSVRGRHVGAADVYRGIPFAQPPTAALRFAAPVAHDGWNGVVDAKRFGPKAMQARSPLGGGLLHPTSEDCLTLNVWAPRTDGPHPVLVWVHGGGQVQDGPANSTYNGSSLARQGLVVVTLSYRLGAFGFLRLGHLLGAEYAGSENNALRDITLGLEWVRSNIAHFGGDPEQITVAGQSAGAKNVTNALAIPRFRRHVKRAIVESGGGHTLLTADEAERVTAAVLDNLDIRPADAEKLLSVDAARVVSAASRVGSSGVHFPWRAVIDDVVLHSDTATAARNGDLRGIGLMVGTNHDEYDLFAVGNSFDRSDPSIGHTTHIRSDDVLNAQLRAYEDHWGASLPARDRRIRLMTAEEYWIPSVRLVEAHVAGGGDAYMYRFDRSPRWSPLKLRAAHFSEVPYVFGTLRTPVARVFTPFPGRVDRVVSGQVQRAWSDFVRSGRPSAPVAWPLYGQDRAVMLIDERWSVALDPSAAEHRLWDGVL